MLMINKMRLGDESNVLDIGTIAECGNVICKIYKNNNLFVE